MNHKKIAVIAGIIVIFAVMLIVPAVSTCPSNKTTMTRARLLKLTVAVLAYSVEQKSYPPGDSISVLRHLRGIDRKAKRRIYLDEPQPPKTFWGTDKYSKPFDKDGNYLDAWGQTIEFSLTGNDIFRCRSKGPDGKYGSGGDGLLLECDIKIRP